MIKVCSRRPPYPWLCRFHRLKAETYEYLWEGLRSFWVLSSAHLQAPFVGKLRHGQATKTVDRTSCGFWRLHPQKVPFSTVRIPGLVVLRGLQGTLAQFLPLYTYPPPTLPASLTQASATFHTSPQLLGDIGSWGVLRLWLEAMW